MSSILTNTRDFFIQNVLASYKDFMDVRRNPKFGENRLSRLGITAATNLYHLREHLPLPIPSFLSIVALCPDYELAKDLANISKHKNPTRNIPQIKNITEYMKIIQYEDEQGSYSHARIDVSVLMVNSASRLLADILYNVMLMWCNYLRDNGIVLGLIDPENVQLPDFVKRENASSVAMEIIAGENRALRCQLLKYNSINKKLEAVDLTDAEIELRIMKPPTSINITLTLNSPQLPKDVSVDVAVPLTEEQGKQYIKLTENERGLYINSVIAQNKDIQLTINEAMQKAIDDQHMAQVILQEQSKTQVE